VKFEFDDGGMLRTVEVVQEGGQYRVSIEGRTYSVSLHSASDGALRFATSERAYQAFVARGPADAAARLWVALDSTVYTLVEPDTARRAQRHHHSEGALTAAMPGQVVNVLVSAGEIVKRGQPLVVLEAMKMELRIAAPQDGVVARVLCTPGQVIERGQQLLELVDT
jgi:3-methylcrotonyl-CoA carboxylase alpha subunit